MRLLVAWTLLVASWVCLIGSPYETAGLVAAVGFGIAAWLVMQLPAPNRR